MVGKKINKIIICKVFQFYNTNINFNILKTFSFADIDNIY